MNHLRIRISSITKSVTLLTLALASAVLLGAVYSTAFGLSSATFATAQNTGTVDVGSLPSAVFNSHSEQAPIGAWHGPGTGPSVYARTGSVAAVTKLSSAALSNVSSSNVVASSGFEGLVEFQSCPCVPPDVQVAAGPNHLFEMVNFAGEILTKQGSVIQNFNLSSFFKTGNNFQSDPKVLYDASSQRWFASIINSVNSFATGNVTFAVSQTSDPTGVWNIYHVSPGAYLPDQPIIGISDDKFVISVNDYSSVFAGAQYWIVNKSDLIAGASSPRLVSFGPFPSLESVHPVQSESSTTTQYLVTVGAGDIGPNSTTLRLISVTGVPGVSTVTNTSATFNVPLIATAPSAPEPSNQFGPFVVDTGDIRVLDAAWSQGKLWLGLDDACQGVSCIRLIEIDTGASSIVQDFDFSSSSLYFFYPALRLDGSGNLNMIYGFSNSGTHPSLAVTGQAFSDPAGSLAPSITVKSGTGTEVNGRYGDYYGAALDPNDTSLVWVDGEYNSIADQTCDPFAHAGSKCWATFIDSMGFPGFSLSATPTNTSFNSGGSATTTVNATSINGFTGTVTLGATSTPSSGLTVSCNPLSLNLGASATSTCTFSSSTPGTYTATITGTSGSRLKTTTVTVSVIGFSISPAGLSVLMPGSSGNITISSVNGFTGNVSLAATVSPTVTNGPTATLNPTAFSISPLTSGSSKLSIAGTSQTPTGLYTVSITGTSGAESHTAFIPIMVSTLSVSSSNTTTFTGIKVTTTVSFTITLGLSANPASVSTLAGQKGTSSITPQGPTGTLTLSNTISPSTGLTCSLSPTTISSGQSSTLSCSGSTGVYTVTVSGTNGAQTFTTTVTFTVQDFSISANPLKFSVRAGSSGTSTITVQSLNSFSGSVSLGATVSPVVKNAPKATLSPTTVSLVPNGSASSTLTFSATSKTPLGTYTVNVTATSGSLVHSTFLSVNVTSARGASLPATSSTATVAESLSNSAGPNGAVFPDPSVTFIVVGSAAVLATNASTGATLFSMTYPLTSLTFNSNVPGTYQTIFLLNVGVSPYPLSSNVIVTITGPTTTVSIAVTRNVDINANGIVDNADVNSVQSALNCQKGQLCYNASADLNADGIINNADLSIATTYLGAPDLRPNFTMSPSSTSIGVPWSGSTSITVTFVSIYGYAGTITLSTLVYRNSLLAPYLEVGITFSSKNLVLTSGSNSTITITFSSSSTGTDSVILTGTSGSLSNSASITLHVQQCSKTCPAP